MTIGEIFGKIREYLRQIFRLFGFFQMKLPEKHKEQKEFEAPIVIGDQKGKTEECGVSKQGQVEKLNKGLEEDAEIEKQKHEEDENRFRQQKEDKYPEEQKKPCIKKSPISSPGNETEEKKQRDSIKREIPEEEKEEKIIDLAEISERKTHIKSPRSGKDDVGEIKRQPDGEKSKKISSYDAARIESPFVDIDIDSKMVSIVLPEQKIKADILQNALPEQNYVLRIENEYQDISARAMVKEEYVILKEKKIEVKKPIKHLEVIFPREFKRTYKYEHKYRGFYIFIARGNDQGKLLYCIDRLPKRLIWVLLTEEYEILEYNAIRVIDESCIWGKYKPFLVDLRQVDTLTIKNKETQEEIKFPCEPSFIVTGDYLIEDDFKLECPLFREGNLKIKAPYENQTGWNVWIQNRMAGSKLISNTWTGGEPLTLDCPKDLPCDFGEFQIDLCELGGESVETLFFRWIPYIEIDYPKQLIIPDCKIGHTEALVVVVLDKSKKWKLKDETGQEIKLKENDHYELGVPPQRERCYFSISAEQEELILNLGVTIPRLKWKLSNQEKWHDRTLNIKKTDLLSEELLDLLVCTNDFNNEYKFTSTLEIESGAQKLQTEKFNRKGMLYAINLNKIYDTIRHYNNNLLLKIEGSNEKGGKQLYSFEALHFEIETPKSKPPRPKPSSYNLMGVINISKLCSFLRKIESNFPGEKRFCREIRQIYYCKLRKRKKTRKSLENDKIKREFILRSLAFLKFLLDKYAENKQIKNKQKIERWIFIALEKYSEEFKNYYGFYS